MHVNDLIYCSNFPCTDVRHTAFTVPNVELDPAAIRMILISESAPADPADYYYTGPQALFEQTTLLAFQDAGLQAASALALLSQGIYLTSAVKCGKTGYGIETGTVQACSHLLEKELALFLNLQVILLMGDVAIKALNAIARRSGQGRVIPAGPTYKIRGGAFSYRGKQVFPSYLQAGPSFFIEKSKRKMIAEDLARGLARLG
jgi:uracil-DNA glycosylase